MWIIFGIGAIIFMVINLVNTFNAHDVKWFRFISMSFVALTLCSFYSEEATRVSNRDFTALSDIMPSMSTTLWISVVLAIVINSVSLLKANQDGEVSKADIHEIKLVDGVSLPDHYALKISFAEKQDWKQKEELGEKDDISAEAKKQLSLLRSEFIIDGNNFSTMAGFYDEVERVFTFGLDWRIGRNLDAFDDILTGGFGRHEDGEPIHIKWINYNKSCRELTRIDKIVEIILFPDDSGHDCTLELL